MKITSIEFLLFVDYFGDQIVGFSKYYTDISDFEEPRSSALCVVVQKSFLIKRKTETRDLPSPKTSQFFKCLAVKKEDDCN